MRRRDSTGTTYYYERWRAVSSGVIESAATTFLLLIAVRGFQAGPTTKAWVAAAGNAGLLITPWVVSWVKKGGWNISRAMSFLAALGALSFLTTALLPFLPVFTLGSILGMGAASAMIPLLTQMYQENYPKTQRGKLFSRTVIIRIGVAALFSQVAGNALSGHMNRAPALLLVFAGAFAFSSFCLSHCPTRPLALSGGVHPFRAMKYLKEDRIFRWTLISWMFMGFGNLMILPMRVEYLANPRYGLAFDTATIAFLTGVMPNLARMAVNPIWGWLFDHLNFFVLRVILNLGFALGILTFFTSDTMTGLFVGALFFGISNAGGDVAWSLWVTKFAAPDRVADYMALHTFFTGIRGVAAPMTAFHLATRFSMGTLGLVSTGFIAAASLMLLPEIRFGKRGRRSSALVEEVSE